MIIALVLQLAAAAPDTARPAPLPSPASVVAEQDTTRRPRRKAVEVSDQYAQRLLIHKVLAYAMLPAFAAQYVSGQKLYDADNGGPRAPSWAKPVHSAGAVSIAGIFGLNTLTGGLNMWESRNTPEHRWLRISHSLIMLGADGAFAYTGIKLASESENSQANRLQHRRVAIYAIGVSTVSGVVMQIFNR